MRSRVLLPCVLVTCAVVMAAVAGLESKEVKEGGDMGFTKPAITVYYSTWFLRRMNGG
eukprot:gene11099-468_t